jgi:phenylacetate-CoA ligase
MGPGVAQEFAGERGPTIWEDHFYPEIVDPTTGELLPDGEEGELVFTSLTKQALPIIRYRTRDLTRLLPGTRTPMRRMAKIAGRSDDMLVVRGVNLFPTQIEELLLFEAALAPHFLLELTRPDRLDELEVHVEARLGADMNDAANAARALCLRIKEATGLSARVTAGPPGSIARSSGKASRVQDRREG